MKKTILLSFFLTVSVYVFSQDVSIELSVHWQVEKDIFNEHSVVNTPIMNIIYRNSSNENIYFKRVSLPDSENLPQTGYSGFYQYPYEEWLNPNWRKRAEGSLQQLNVGQDYKVEIGSFQFCTGSWDIVNKADTCLCTKDMINDDISDIYAFIYHKKHPERFDFSSKFQFKKEDLAEDSILTINRKYFIFLKPNEMHIDTFNIIAFQLVKGNFTFTVRADTIPNYVNIESVWDENKKMWQQQTAVLPEKIGIYKLYSGWFYTNDIEIKFK